VSDTSLASLPRIAVTIIFGAFWFISCATMFHPDIQQYMGVSSARRSSASLLMKYIAFMGLAFSIGMVWLQMQ
jgi:hypothetical protein